MCFTVRRASSVWFAVGFHAADDFAETFLFSVNNSGNAAQGQLLHSTTHGPAWLTGGAVKAFSFFVHSADCDCVPRALQEAALQRIEFVIWIRSVFGDSEARTRKSPADPTERLIASGCDVNGAAAV
jgi:hypothetical protein